MGQFFIRQSQSPTMLEGNPNDAATKPEAWIEQVF
jgi:hypothetical protein